MGLQCVVLEGEASGAGIEIGGFSSVGASGSGVLRYWYMIWATRSSCTNTWNAVVPLPAGVSHTLQMIDCEVARVANSTATALGVAWQLASQVASLREATHQ